MKSPSLDVPILAALFATPGHYVSGADLASQLNVSRSAIWKHIEQLQTIGYPIESQPHYGYRLTETPDVLCADEILARLNLGSPRPSSIPWHPVVFKSTASTNDLVSREAQNGHPEGLAVIAEAQLSGRGRQGRVWESPPKGGLYASVLLRPDWALNQLTRLTILSGLAAAETVEQLTGKKPQIKWPNDIVLNGKKLGGILTEAQCDPDRIRAAIIGIGLNLNQTARDFSPAVRKIATSLRLETGQGWRRADAVLLLLRRLETHYRLPFAKIRDAWSSRCLSLGQRLTLNTPQGVRQGQAVGLDENGALLLRQESGKVETITVGEIVS
jgi:BirA family biotin operon repressor/biotin-[acetyl-CoA-carboxylase] ligase